MSVYASGDFIDSSFLRLAAKRSGVVHPRAPMRLRNLLMGVYASGDVSFSLAASRRWRPSAFHSDKAHRHRRRVGLATPSRLHDLAVVHPRAPTRLRNLLMGVYASGDVIDSSFLRLAAKRLAVVHPRAPTRLRNLLMSVYAMW